MTPERTREIYEQIKAVVITMPRASEMSHGTISKVLADCDDFITKLADFLVEIIRDMDRLQTVIGEKEDFYETRTEELLISHPDVLGLPTERAKSSRVRYLLKDEFTEIRKLKDELSISKSLRDVVRNHQKIASEKNMNVKKLWEIFNNQLRLMHSGLRDATAVTFEDEDVSKVVLGTDSTPEQDKATGEVDPDKISAPQAEPGKLYAVAPQNSNDGKNSKAESQPPSIIEEGGDDIDSIIGRL